MCGLICGFSDTVTIAKQLKQLQYRGCDSWSLSLFQQEVPLQFKKLGSNIDLEEISNSFNHSGLILGHSRWSDTSVANLPNCQPILSFNRNILLIHNGSLHSYDKIKSELNYNYTVNTGDSDTCVLADYIDMLYKDHYWWYDIKQLIDLNFKGTYALVWITKYDNKTIHFAVKDNPLYYYNGQFSSDPCLFPKYYIIPNNSYGQFINEENNKMLYVYLNGQIISFPENEVPYIENYSYSSESNSETTIDFMRKEIEEQATCPYICGFTKDNGTNDNDITGAYNFIQMIGMGSSLNAALLIQKIFELDYRISVSNAAEYNYIEGRNHLEIAISQSGETLDVLETLRKIPAYENSLLVTNRPNSTCENHVNEVLYIGAGAEYGVAATKSFTATVFALYNLFSPKKLDFDDFRNLVKELITQPHFTTIKGIAWELLNNDFKNVLVLGSEYNYPIAKEVALKITECSYIHSDSLPSSSVKHGFLSLCNEQTLVIFLFDTETEKYPRTLNNIKQIKARGAKVLGIGQQSEDVFDWWIPTPKTNHLFSCLLNNINGQILAYQLAILQGYNPSQPRFLAKAITVY